jgi:Sulfatase
MKILTHPAMLALGLATLCLLTLIGPLVSPTHTGVYHLSGSAFLIFAPILIVLCIVWFVFALLLWFARKPGWFHTIIWTGLIIFLPWILLKDWFALTLAQTPRWLQVLGLFLPIMICGIVFVSRRPSFAPVLRRVQDFAIHLLAFASLSAIVIVCQLLWFGWQARGLNARLSLHRQQSAVIKAAAKPRFVWILLDELSYQQVYEERFAGLNLPAFDQLADQSTVFTHVVPAGIVTEIAIPSLLTGVPTDRIRVSANGRQVSLHNSKDGDWTSLDPHQTVFQDALDAGYSTAIAGWYNPYCRILPQVLDDCFWTNHVAIAGGMFAGQTVEWNTVQFLLHRFDRVSELLSAPGQSSPALIRDAQFHQKDYRELFTAADKFLINSSANFVFLHMPVPHPGGIYDRKNSAFTTGHASYVDNLALADRYLAHVRLILEQRGEWNPSTVVVMGDHAWRTKLVWAGSESWTAEDQAASHGAQFDDRPAYIVKLPNQQQSARIDDRFDAVRTRALLDGIITNRIKTPEDLASWVRQQN